jgi:hypothetical protein
MRAAAVPAAILVIVALGQIALAKGAGLTPWKGGGFGMFATLDHGAYRGVDVVIEAPERSEALNLPPSLEELGARAAACPSEWLLRQLGAAIVARERRYGRPVASVTLTVWATDFDRRTLAATERTVRAFVYRVPE